MHWMGQKESRTTQERVGDVRDEQSRVLISSREKLAERERG